jgi:hypothetical protein
MKKFALIMILVIGLGGCTTLTKPGAPFYSMGQKRKLSSALSLIQQRKTADASELLTAICKEPPVPGVTDEALFRLSLLHLESDIEANGTAKSKSDLDRLVKEYPDSTWVQPASTLSEFLSATDNKLQHDGKLKELIISLTRENRELKERNFVLSKEQRVLKDSNLSLLKENTELRQNVEKLKTIDLDLEKRPKR